MDYFQPGWWHPVSNVINHVYVVDLCFYSSYLLYKSSTSLPVPDSIVPIEGSSPLVISATSTDGLKFDDLGDVLQQTVDENTPTSYSRMFTTPSNLAAVATGLPFQV